MCRYPAAATVNELDTVNRLVHSPLTHRHVNCILSGYIHCNFRIHILPSFFSSSDNIPFQLHIYLKPYTISKRCQEANMYLRMIYEFIVL